MKAEIKKGHKILFSEGHSNDWSDLGDVIIINFMNKYTFKGFKQNEHHLLIDTTEGDVEITFLEGTPNLSLESYCKDQLVLKLKSEEGGTEWLRKQNRELKSVVMEQKDLINNMRDVLRFCARSGVGTYYQQQSAKKNAVRKSKNSLGQMQPRRNLQ